MLKLINVKKDYKVADTTVNALKGVSLEFRRNEFVCILGQSGCGKTTLLNIIGGLDHYTSGDLVISGKSTKDYKDRDWDIYRNHRIGFIFQSYNLIPHQTVLGNVELALTISGIGKEERRKRAVQALERVGLKAHLNKRPNQLSGGQMQRVAIARALVNNPAILLADEPTGALDSETSVQIMDLIREIAGERLVIMVTHNPELAEQYATRIVRLKDGLVEADSDPYDGTEDRKKMLERFKERKEILKNNKKLLKQEKKRAKLRNKRMQHAQMSFKTALSLSARNLITKKGRTIVTSIAGSIGIISVCLVLALSAGFNNYILHTEEDMLSNYPLQITESTMDMSTIMTNMMSSRDFPDMEKIGDRVYVNSFLTKMAQGMTVTNNLSDEYVNYLDELDESYYNAIMYKHGVTITDNLFTSIVAGTSDEDAETQYRSLSSIKSFYTTELTSKASQYASLAGMVALLGNVVSIMPDTLSSAETGFCSYVGSQYDVIAGKLPQSKEDVVLVVGDNNAVTDLTLAQLGFIDEPDFLDLFNVGEEGETEEFRTIEYDSILSSEFVLYFNDAVYSPVTGMTAKYPFAYNGLRESLEIADGNGLKLNVSGILRLKDGLSYGCLSSGLNVTEELIEYYIEQNMKSQIVEWMNDPANAFSFNVNGLQVTAHRAPAEHLTQINSLGYSSEYTNGLIAITFTPVNALRYLGGSDSVSAISIYAKDFAGKDQILNYLDAWNNADDRAEEDKITYSDTVGMLMTMMQTILNVITYVLVAFTAISLVVSSVMIGIITYVSVVERVKEIGVLRSLGARKQDIRNLFNAETFIIGLSSGVFGVVVTYLISLIVNAIMLSLTGIANLAALPFTSALIMIAVSVVLTLISGLVPASAAAKKDPVIALRTE